MTFDRVRSAATGPGWRGWLIWGVGVAAYMLAVVNRSSLSAVGVDTAERFGADAATLSMFAVVQLAVYGGMQIPIGLLLDRYGARPIMTIGMLLMAAGQLTLAFSPSVGVAIFARMLLGAGDAAVFPGVLRLIATWFPAQRGPLMSQLTGLVGQAGQLLALAPLASLLHATSWEIAFGGIAGLCVLFAILVAVFIRNHPPEIGADVTVDTDTGAIKIVRSSMDTGVGIRRGLGASRHASRVLVALHDPLRRHRLRAAVGHAVPHRRRRSVEAARRPRSCRRTSWWAWALGPIMGDLSRRIPHLRSRALVLPAIAMQATVWLIVIAWPGPAPIALLYLLAFALAMGGPASMIAFDHARTHNPAHRLSTATGITNVGGFLAALIAIFAIGLALDLQGAGTPSTYRLGAFRLAFLTQVPLWVIGWTFIVIERRKTRVVMGLDEPRTRRSGQRGATSTH
ncbi:MAG: MFS transporter [Microbacterium sp.]